MVCGSLEAGLEEIKPFNITESTKFLVHVNVEEM